ncbi:hypothetical protein CIK05_11665 [Bdellovibrio sp. qaytius]|nr:hypothetical protein CIK05_11665 [Bdellovibrio sp. qaytius]
MKSLFAVLLILFSSRVFAETNFLYQLQQLEQNKDNLGMRILVKKNYKTKFSVGEWDKVRKILKGNYSIGLDAVIAWDRQASITGSSIAAVSTEYTKTLEEADKLMLANKFSEAFDKYQAVAQDSKAKSRGVIEKSNYQFYYNVLHQMGRALYSQKKFNDALEVYSWIKPNYFQARQVMFEKMWASFMAKRYDLALGAIASQNSGYFSKYLDPESYLVQIYILKRLCYTTQLDKLVAYLKKYKSDLQTNKVNLKDWARADILRFSLVQILDEKTPPEMLKYVSAKERADEKNNIIKLIQAKYQSEKPVIIDQINRIIGYALLAANENNKILENINKLPDSKELSKTGFEFWPASDREEWFDEIGSHVFIGATKCVSKK